MIPQEAIDHELGFWKDFVLTEQFSTWLAPGRTPELDEEVADFILQSPHDMVLDVGSGVVSILNGLIPQKNLSAVDPLGQEYKKIFNYECAEITPPIVAAAENLGHMTITQWDIVHMRNAIDHSQDPMKAYTSLLSVTKTGGHLIIQGFENEGKYMNWVGMHQWNFSLDLDKRLLKCENAHVAYHFENPLHCIKKSLPGGRTWFIWIVKKAIS